MTPPTTAANNGVAAVIERIYVGGLDPSKLTINDVASRLKSVDGVDVLSIDDGRKRPNRTTKKEEEENRLPAPTDRTYFFLDARLSSSDPPPKQPSPSSTSTTACGLLAARYHNVTWKNCRLTIEPSKPHFLDRLKVEREELRREREERRSKQQQQQQQQREEEGAADAGAAPPPPSPPLPPRQLRIRRRYGEEAYRVDTKPRTECSWDGFSRAWSSLKTRRDKHSAKVLLHMAQKKKKKTTATTTLKGARGDGGGGGSSRNGIDGDQDDDDERSDVLLRTKVFLNRAVHVRFAFGERDDGAARIDDGDGDGDDRFANGGGDDGPRRGRAAVHDDGNESDGTERSSDIDDDDDDSSGEGDSSEEEEDRVAAKPPMSKYVWSDSSDDDDDTVERTEHDDDDDKMVADQRNEKNDHTSRRDHDGRAVDSFSSSSVSSESESGGGDDDDDGDGVASRSQLQHKTKVAAPLGAFLSNGKRDEDDDDDETSLPRTTGGGAPPKTTASATAAYDEFAGGMDFAPRLHNDNDNDDDDDDDDSDGPENDVSAEDECDNNTDVDLTDDVQSNLSVLSRLFPDLKGTQPIEPSRLAHSSKSTTVPVVRPGWEVSTTSGGDYASTTSAHIGLSMQRYDPTNEDSAKKYEIVTSGTKKEGARVKKEDVRGGSSAEKSSDETSSSDVDASSESEASETEEASDKEAGSSDTVSSESGESDEGEDVESLPKQQKDDKEEETVESVERSMPTDVNVNGVDVYEQDKLEGIFQKARRESGGGSFQLSQLFRDQPPTLQSSATTTTTTHKKDDDMDRKAQGEGVEVYEQGKLENIFQSAREGKSSGFQLSQLFQDQLQAPSPDDAAAPGPKSSVVGSGNNSSGSFAFSFDVGTAAVSAQRQEESKTSVSGVDQKARTETTAAAAAIPEGNATVPRLEPRREITSRSGMMFPKDVLDDYEAEFFRMNGGDRVLADWEGMRNEETSQAAWHEERRSLTLDWKRKQKYAMSKKHKRARYR